jgi:hypothetical protein
MSGAVGWNAFVLNARSAPELAGATAIGQPTGDVRGALGGSPGELPPVGDEATAFGNGAPALPEPKAFRNDGASGTLLSLRDFNTLAVSIQQIAQVIQDQNLQSREAARQDRELARDADIAAQQKAADEIRRGAIFSLVSTVVSSSMAIGGGALQMRGATQAFQTYRQAAATPQNQLTNPAAQIPKPGGSVEMDNLAAKRPPPPAQDPQVAALERRMRISEAEPKARYQADMGTARGQIATETGKIGGALLNIGTAEAEAEKAEQLAESAKMRTRAEDETDFIRAYADNVRAVQEKLAALQQAEADTNRQIVRA